MRNHYGALLDRSNVLTAVGLILALVSLRCDEQLPAHIDPVIPFRATMDAIYFGAPDTGWAGTENAINFYYSIRYPVNAYNETFQGPAELSADLEIIWAESSTHIKTIHLDKYALIEIRRTKYDPGTNILTMDPGNEMTFFYSWHFVDDRGDSLLNLFPKHIDSTCFHWDTVWVQKDSFYLQKLYPRKFSNVSFIVNSKAKLFRQFSTYYAPQSKFFIQFETWPKRCP